MDNDLIQDTNLDLLQVQVAEVEYSGQAPINVDNQEHIISLDPSALSSKLDTSAFDEWTATHSGESVEYTAGPNIDITNHVVSGRDWTDEITAASANAVNEAVNQIPDVSEFLTKTSADTLYYPLESNPSGYLTAHQDLSEYAKTDDLSAYQEKGDYYSASNPSGFITGVDLSNYYEKNETSSKEEIENAITSVENVINNLSGEYYPLNSNPSGYLTAHQDVSDKLDVTAFTSYTATADTTEYSAGDGISITNHTISVTAQLTGDYLTKESADTLYQPIGNYQTAGNYQSAGNYLSATDSANFYPMTGNPSGFLTGVDLTPYQEKTAMTAYQPAGDYYSASNPSGFITGVDLSNYYQKNETSSKEEISGAFEALSGIDDPYELSAGDGISIVNDNTAKKTIISSTGISSKLDTSAFTAYTATAVQGFEYTGIAPIDVNNTTHQISADVWTLSARNGIAILEDDVNKITTLDFVGGSAFYPMTGNPSGFLTSHQSLSNYYTKNETSSKTEISNALTGKQNNLTFAYNSSDAISSINGSALAGGTETTIDLSAGEGISIVETADKVVISNNISAGSNMSFVYDSETNKIRIDANDAFPITATDGNTTWSADCKASAFTMARNTSRTDIGAYGFEYRQAPSVNVSGTWYDLAVLMEKFKYAIPVEAVANSGLATGQNILYIVTGN